MVRKALALLCCVCLLLTAPGSAPLFAQSAITLENETGSQFLWSEAQLITVPTVNAPAVAGVPVDLEALGRGIRDLKVDPEMKARAQELIDRRLLPFLGDRNNRPPEVEAAIRRFNDRVRNPAANKELLLLELFEGLEAFATRMEESTNFTDVLQDNDQVRIVRTSNAYQHRMVQEIHAFKLTPTTKKLAVYTPDPRNPGRKILDRVAYVYTKDGVEHQKVVWSRRLLEVAQSIRRSFHERPDLLDELRDAKTEQEKRFLQAALDDTRRRYAESGIEDIIKQMGGPESERLKDGKFTPAELEALNKRLVNWQAVIQQFYAKFQLEDFQKQILGEIITYFSGVASIPNPLHKKDGTDLSRMKMEDVQKLLDDFENGSYTGFGRFGDALSKLSDWFKLKYRVMDPERDMPPALKRVTSLTIHYLGLAADARRRMEAAHAAGRSDERSAALQELNDYLKRVRVELQTFELYSSSISLEDLRDGKSQQMRLREADHPEATRLIESARRDFVSKYVELGRRTERRLLEDAAGAFGLTLHNAVSMNLPPDDFKEKVDVLSAKAKQLRALFLAQRFARFIENPANLKAYRDAHGGGANGEYYGSQAQGGLYAFFLAHLDGETVRLKGVFDRVVTRLGAVTRRDQLTPIQDDMEGLMRLLGLTIAPDPAQVQRDTRKLAVFQTWLDASVKQLKGNLELFTRLHELDLNIEKHATSNDSPETRDANALDRAMGLDWMNPLLNVGGIRHGMGQLSARIFAPKAYAMLGDPKQRALRDDIMGLMREQRYAEARQKIIDMDPEAAAKARRRYEMAQQRETEESGLDVESLLSKGFSNEAMAQARGVLKAANDNLTSYRLAYAGGTMVFDLGAMTLLTPFAGAGLALAASVVARGLAGGARIIRAAETVAGAGRIMSIASKGLGVVSRPVVVGMEFGGRIFDGAANNLIHGLRLAEVRNFVSSPVATGVDMWKASAGFTWKAMTGTATMGGMIETGGYYLNKDSSPYHSGSEALWQGALQNGAWGAKGGVLFALQTPSSAIHSTHWLAKGYQYFGNTTGLLHWGGDLAAVIGTKFFSWGWAKAALKNEMTVFGHVTERVQGIASPVRQLAARTALWAVSTVDNGAKFMLVFEGVQEVAQAVSYVSMTRHWGVGDWTFGLSGVASAASAAIAVVSAATGRFAAAGRWLGTSAKLAAVSAVGWGSNFFFARKASAEPVKGDPDFTPSEHLRAVADSRRGALAFGQIAFLLIPSAGYASSKEVARSRETTAGVDALYKRGGEDLNRFFSTPANGSAKIMVDVDWQNLGLRQLVGKREVEVPATTELKAKLAYMWLAKEKVSLAELIAMEMVPETVPGKKGKGASNHQLFWTTEELKRFARGEAVSPMDRAKREAAEAAGRSYDVPKDSKGVYFLIPEVREAASRLIGERLFKDQKLAKTILDADAGQVAVGKDGKTVVVRKGRLQLGDVLIEDPQTIRMVQERARAIIFEHEKEQTIRDLMGRLRAKDAEIFSDAMHSLAPDERSRRLERIADEAWDGLVKGMSQRGNLARVMAELKDKIKSQLILRYNADWLTRHTRAAAGGHPDKVVEKFIQTIDGVLGWGYTKNQQGISMTGLRDVQKTALRDWAKAVVDGDQAKATRIFVFLKASGGKTLLTYTAFLPYLQVRADAGGRKVWLTTSNELLAEQFKADWKAYAGGMPPDFKVTSVDEAKFEEAFRLERGERSIGREYVLGIDEADENFRKPSNSIGDPNGELREAHPMTDLRLMGLERALEMPQGLAGKAKEAWLDKNSRELAAEWRATMRQVAPSVAEPLSFAKYWTLKGFSRFGLARNPGSGEIRREAAKLRQVAHEEYGRLSPHEKAKVDGWLSKARRWAMDDGVETFLRSELLNHDKTIRLGSKRSEHIKIELQEGKVTPINFASAMPTLSTEYRTTAQLLAIKLRGVIKAARGPGERSLSQAEVDRLAGDKRVGRLLENVPVETRTEFQRLLMQRGKVEWGDAQIDNPLKNKRIPTENGQSMTLKEFFQRLKEADTDIILFSGTAGRKVKEYLKDEIKVDLVNKPGETKMPRRSFLIVDDAGRVTIARRSGKVDVLDWSKELSSPRLKVEPPLGIDHPNPEKIRLMLRIAEMNLQAPLGKGEKALTILAPRTMDEYKTLRKAVVDSGLAKESEIVAYFPDFVQQGREEYRLDAANAENNIAAMRDGTAKIVLLVPEIGGRGTDMPFKLDHKDGNYMRFVMVGENVHDVAEVEDRQAKARLGELPGDRIPKGGRMEYVDITSTKSLLGSEEYRAEVKKLVEAALGRSPADKEMEDVTLFRKKLVADKKAELQALLPKDKKALDKLLDEKSAEFKAFATRGEVYKIMVELMQEKRQLEANETSGILTPSKGLTKQDVSSVQTLVSMVGTGLGWFLGFPMLGAMGGWLAGEGARWWGNRYLPAGDKAQSSMDQLKGLFKKSASPGPRMTPAH